MPDITHQQILDKIDVSSKSLLEAMTEQLGVITDNMVTKQDLKEELKHFVTKDDLKEELKRFATKDELKDFATKKDVREIVGDELRSPQTKKYFRGIVREETADIRGEQLRQGALLEALDNDVKAIAESVSNELKLKRQLDKHDGRIATLESKSKIITSTVTHHSDQLKALQAARP